MCTQCATKTAVFHSTLFRTCLFCLVCSMVVCSYRSISTQRLKTQLCIACFWYLDLVKMSGLCMHACALYVCGRCCEVDYVKATWGCCWQGNAPYFLLLIYLTIVSCCIQQRDIRFQLSFRFVIFVQCVACHIPNTLRRCRVATRHFRHVLGKYSVGVKFKLYSTRRLRCW